MKNLLTYLFLVTLLVSCNKENKLNTENSSPEAEYLKCKIPSEDNFWKVATPASQQMDENVIYGLGEMVKNLNNVKSFLVIRNGKIIHEQYLNGAGEDSLLNICSVTKRITSSLIGIAIDKKIITSKNTPISRYFPEISYMGADPKWNNITIYHLLNMISGMDWIEVNDLPAFEYTFNNPNPLPLTFSRSIVNQPGTIFSYNSPGVHLLSYVIERASKKSVTSFVNNNLFGPLKIKNFKWQADGNNVKNGGANLYLASRDLAKIGLLYLQNGMWMNQRVISKKWIDESLRTPVNLDTLQGSYLSTGPYLVSKPGMSMGNTWWTMNFMGETIHYGDGYGGQILLLIPKYNVIIVMNRLDNVSVNDNINAFNEFFNQVLPMVIVSINKS
jgi:CubicO group peptidase (beta-lactamase class C family)